MTSNNTGVNSKVTKICMAIEITNKKSELMLMRRATASV